MWFDSISKYAFTQTILRDLWLGEDVKESIDRPRIHHQLAPMQIEDEEDLPEGSYRLT